MFPIRMALKCRICSCVISDEATRILKSIRNKSEICFSAIESIELSIE